MLECAINGGRGAMNLRQLFEDSSLRAKARAVEIGAALVQGRLAPEELLDFAGEQSGAIKATCLEGLELATRKMPDLGGPSLFDFLCDSLDAEEPRVKWESARVIGNVARWFPDRVHTSVKGLLRNATHKGTVVRWASAFALGEILLLDAGLRDELFPKIQRLCDQEENSGVKKNYVRALGRAL